MYSLVIDIEDHARRRHRLLRSSVSSIRRIGASCRRVVLEFTADKTGITAARDTKHRAHGSHLRASLLATAIVALAIGYCGIYLDVGFVAVACIFGMIASGMFRGTSTTAAVDLIAVRNPQVRVRKPYRSTDEGAKRLIAGAWDRPLSA